MVISPRNAAMLKDEEIKTIERLERDIDGELNTGYIPQKPFIYPFTETPGDRILSSLRDRYKRAGWDVTYVALEDALKDFEESSRDSEFEPHGDFKTVDDLKKCKGFMKLASGYSEPTYEGKSERNRDVV